MKWQQQQQQQKKDENTHIQTKCAKTKINIDICPIGPCSACSLHNVALTAEAAHLFLWFIELITLLTNNP